MAARDRFQRRKEVKEKQSLASASRFSPFLAGCTQVEAMRHLLDDQMEEMHGLFVAQHQRNKRMFEPQWSSKS